MAKDRRAMANPFAGIAKEETTTVETDQVQPKEVSISSPQPKARTVTARPEAREFVGFRLSPALLERARAVAWTKRLTLTAYVEASIEAAVVSSEREHGGPFPPVPRRRRAV